MTFIFCCIGGKKVSRGGKATKERRKKNRLLIEYNFVCLFSIKESEQSENDFTAGSVCGVAKVSCDRLEINCKVP